VVVVYRCRVREDKTYTQGKLGGQGLSNPVYRLQVEGKSPADKKKGMISHDLLQLMHPELLIISTWRTIGRIYDVAD